MQVDVHSHIIPGVDDGSQNIETSIELLRMAAACGTTDIIATPHVIDVSTTLTWNAIRRHVEALQKIADEQGIPVRIYPGAETELNWDLLELIRQDHSAFCLAGSRYCLMEMPSLMLPPHLEEMIYELQLLDIVPVLAHPERQMQLMEQPEKMLELLKRGCVAQCNGGSLTGIFGPKAHEKVHMLLNNNMVAFMGSDAHNLKHRNTDLRGAKEKLIQHWGETTLQEIVETKPRYILENKPMPDELYMNRLPDAVVIGNGKKGKNGTNGRDSRNGSEKKKGFFARLFG